VTVLQNAPGQAEKALAAARDLLAGKTLGPVIYVPFELVTPDSLAGSPKVN